MVPVWSDRAEALGAQQQPWERRERSLVACLLTPEWWVEALL